ncbi:MAG: outer membrane beta-barrel protein [Aestuariivirga sp.]
MPSRRPLAVSLAAGLWLAAGIAHGQQITQLRPGIDDTGQAEQVPAAPIKRQQQDATDPYEPVGLRAGGIIFYPAFTIAPAATSNVRQASSGEQSAIGLRLKPSARFASDWVRHAWVGNATYDRIDYLDHEDFTSHRADIFSKFRLDIRHTTRAEFEAAYHLDQTGLADSEIPATAVGYRAEHQINAAAALIQDFGPLEARIKAGIGWKLYGDVKLSGGGTEDNSDRDYTTPSLSLRTTYTDPPVFKPYVQAAYEPRYYLRKLDRNGLRRSSQGFAASAGVVIDHGPIWSGDLAATYLWRDYEDATLKSNSAFGLTGSLTWSPTELTKIVFELGTSLAEQVGTSSSGDRVWTGSIDFTHELRDNIDVLAGAGVELEDGSSGDMTYDANLGLVWKLGPSLAWTAGYDVTWLDAAPSSRGYTEHRISAGLTISR